MLERAQGERERGAPGCCRHVDSEDVATGVRAAYLIDPKLRGRATRTEARGDLQCGIARMMSWRENERHMRTVATELKSYCKYVLWILEEEPVVKRVRRLEVVTE